ncbi:beta-carotene 15,15'-monooxygenase [Pedobacter changchengzhani]|uniref:Beta-carotene 15,15'-monooxygenase n=1 Tax=Pedobacter changchengzhani TaxID=2529274 RepID=A0A4R5MLP2_9SPHI|nr:beta-carotene 15,15'-monooxygenase [Pedobacter changchengzhani]TDG36558.1 beta-carotene 15,15'-monooxygenase [Pedobacter changchengzhani]
MDKAIPIFRDWVPDWLVKVFLFLLILPSTVLFFLPMANVAAAAGYYGAEPADIQFSVALFYAGYVGFYSLERRFFRFVATKEYFIIFTFLQIITTLICYKTNELYVFFPVRFFQGMLFSSSVNLSLSLMFSRLKSERAREVSFSVFFGLLLCALPFNNLVTANLIDSFNFNIVYKGAVFSYLPCLVLLLISMNNTRLNVRFPLSKLDWQSFTMYSIMLCIVGYICIYGQEYYWLNDLRIRYAVIVLFGLMLVFLVRQKSMKRPYIDLNIFRFRNFYVGLIVLFVMYISRFASGITNNFFSGVLGFDPMHVSYINVTNLLGLILGVIIACCLTIQKQSVRMIWFPGFSLLLIYYCIMFFLFDIQADEQNYLLPLFIQGLGIGLIMVPAIVYAISSVPAIIGSSASAVCLAIRFVGFCASIAIINYAELYGKSKHFNSFQDRISIDDPIVKASLKTHSTGLMSKGFLNQSGAIKASGKLLIKRVEKQGTLRFAMDYYEFMAIMLIVILLLIAVFPHLNKTVLYLRSKRLAPA